MCRANTRQICPLSAWIPESTIWGEKKKRKEF